jgi:hypothetical protein
MVLVDHIGILFSCATYCSLKLLHKSTNIKWFRMLTKQCPFLDNAETEPRNFHTILFWRFIEVKRTIIIFVFLAIYYMYSCLCIKVSSILKILLVSKHSLNSLNFYCLRIYFELSSNQIVKYVYFKIVGPLLKKLPIRSLC